MKKPAAYKLDTTALVTDADGEEHEVNVVVWFNASYQAARLGGLPENCSPEEGELEIVKIEVDNVGLPYGVSEQDVVAGMMDDEDVEQECWDEYFDQRNER